MTFRSLSNKYGKTLAFIGTGITIADYIVKWLFLLSPIIVFVALGLGCVFVLPGIIRFRSFSVFERFLISGCIIVVLLGLGFYTYSKSVEPKTSSVAINDNHSTNNTYNSLNSNNTNSKTEAQNSTQTINKSKNTIVINGGVTASDSAKLTIANEIHNYYTPSPRHLKKQDVTRLKPIALKTDRIRVLYPPNSNEGLAYAMEIFNKLRALGHKSLSIAMNENPTEKVSERFSIKNTQEPEAIINIIINPQQ